MPTAGSTSLRNLSAAASRSGPLNSLAVPLPIVSRRATAAVDGNMPFCPRGTTQDLEDEFSKPPRSLRWRLKFAKKELDDRFGADVIRLNNGHIVKRGCESTEYEALQMVNGHTSVRVPKVLGVYQTREGVLVELEVERGTPLDNVWPNLGMRQRRTVVDDVARFVEDLRKIEPPKHIVIGSATMGAAYDSRFGHQNGRLGPFYTLESFHSYIRRGHPLTDFTEQKLRHCHDNSYEMKFTHANLCPRNILIDESCRVSSILGWEQAGWYPEYWEYTQMHHKTPSTLVNWLEAMAKVMPTYEDELAADDTLRSKYSGSVYDTPRSVRAPSPSLSELAREQREIDDKNTEHTSG